MLEDTTTVSGECGTIVLSRSNGQWVSDYLHSKPVRERPEGLLDMYTRGLGRLSVEQSQVTKQLLLSEQDLFFNGLDVLGSISADKTLRRNWDCSTNQIATKSSTHITCKGSYWSHQGNVRAKHDQTLQESLVFTNCLWSVECQEAFTKLKSAPQTGVLLGYPDPSKPCVLDIDGSKSRLGAVLSQEHDSQELVIAYFSQTQPPQDATCWLLLMQLSSLSHTCMDGSVLLRTQTLQLFKGPKHEMAIQLMKLEPYRFDVQQGL